MCLFLPRNVPLIILWWVLGLVALTVGAEWLVRGASQLAIRIGISPLVVGLTIVAFGTSAPEMVVSIGASLKGQTDVAVGNVVGSNICNTLLILGLTAVVAPLRVSPQLIRFDMPLLIVITLIVWGLAFDNTMHRIESGGLFLALLAYTTWSVVASRRKTKRDSDQAAQDAADAGEPPPNVDTRIAPGAWGLTVNLFLLIVGFVLLVTGANWFIESAIGIARYLGVSELLIGLTLVAVGTSLPEVATSVVAAFRGERDIAVGNVIGSNMFNLLGVLGAAGAISATGLPISDIVLQRDMLVMVLATIVCWPIFLNGRVVYRVEGGLLLVAYFGYLAYLAQGAIAASAAGAAG